MNELQSKLREVAQSILPIILYVVFCALVFVPVEPVPIWRFLLGSVFLFIGLTLFLWGVDQSMTPIGVQMASFLASFKTRFASLAFAFLLGFLITVAEPDLLILGQQIEQASAGAVQARFFVLLVSLGVGLMIALGALKILISKPWRKLFTLAYLLIFALAFFAGNEFIAFAFDASGATTGAITTPFILAISYGLSRMKGSGNDQDSFGLVGTMSAGPILATLLYAAFISNARMQAAPLVIEGKGVVALFIALGHLLIESLTALAPIALLFFFLNWRVFHLKKRALFSIVRGLVYSLLGLTFFLAGANEGFMDMGKLLGTGLVAQGPWVLLLMSFILGYLVVSAEPAVLVLGRQVEEVTGGYLDAHIMGRTLSIGVGIAVMLSTLRILLPGLSLWHFLLPGFLLALVLSWYVDDLFVGIAFDAGGVASGPMAATFVLSFTQGIASKWPTADLLADGFGIIAMIAMTPVIAILLVGALAKKQSSQQVPENPAPSLSEKALPILPQSEFQGVDYSLLMVNVKHGLGAQVVEVARERNARGATILHGRDERGRHWVKYRLALDPQRDMVWFLVETDKVHDLADALLEVPFEGQAPDLVVLPVYSAAGLSTFGSMPEDKEEEGPQPFSTTNPTNGVFS